jgi:hypothetical protein
MRVSWSTGTRAAPRRCNPARSRTKVVPDQQGMKALQLPGGPVPDAFGGLRFRENSVFGGVAMQTVKEAIAVIRGRDYDARTAAEEFLARTARFEELQPYLADDDWKVRLFVARAVAQLPGPSTPVAAELQRRLEVEEDDWVRNNLRWGVECHTMGRPDGEL